MKLISHCEKCDEWETRTKSAPLHAFSLLEMIGVLAVAAIIALAFALTTTKSLDTAFATQEATVLQNFANAFQNSVLRTRSIPAVANWAQAIATELGLGSNVVALTDRSTARVFMLDTGSSINGASVVNGYVQTYTGSDISQAVPTYRAIILSSLSPQSSISTMTGGASFSTLWNTNDTLLPADLKIQRINLGQLFVYLQLTNVPSSSIGTYRIDGNPSTAASPAQVAATGLNAYFIQNTGLTLIDTNSTPGTVITNAELLLTKNIGFYYVNNIWRSTPFAPDVMVQTTQAGANLADMFAIAANMFANAPVNTNALSGATPLSTLNSMSNFMSQYLPYAAYATNYAATNNGAWPVTGTLYTNALNAQQAVANAMNNLANNITTAGCVPQ